MAVRRSPGRTAILFAPFREKNGRAKRAQRAEKALQTQNYPPDCINARSYIPDNRNLVSGYSME